MWFKPLAPIVLDCDGVVLDFDLVFPHVAQDVLGHELPLERKSNEYSLDLRYGLSQQDMLRVLDAYAEHEKGWAGLPLIAGADEVIKDLQGRGHPVHMVTGIDNCMRVRRIENLAKHEIEVDAVHCVGMGHSSKEQVIREINPIVFVDDRLRLLHECSFVPHRVFVDRGDTQDGFHPDAGVHVCTDLYQWHSDVYLPQASRSSKRTFPR